MNRSLLALLFTACSTLVFAQSSGKQDDGSVWKGPKGWAFDIGGQYTYMAFSTQPTFLGSAGGTVGKATYQTSQRFFTQVRSVFNAGTLKSGSTSSHDLEWYGEWVGGYCSSIVSSCRFTPYVGAGLEYLWDNRDRRNNVGAIDSTYRVWYAIIGMDVQCAWDRWTVGGQVDCMPTFSQHLSSSGAVHHDGSLKQRVGVNLSPIVSYKINRFLWLQASPFYRFFPFGSSPSMGVQQRTLNEGGLYLILRFFPWN